jgi:hypothetical protein
MSGKNAKDAEVLVNAVLDSYLELAWRAEKQDQMIKLDELRKIYDSSNKLLREEKDLLGGLVKTLKSADPAIMKLRQKEAFRRVGMFDRELLRVELDLLSAGGKDKEAALKAKAAFLGKALKQAKADAESACVVSSELEVKRAEVNQAEELVKRLREKKMLMEVEI